MVDHLLTALTRAVESGSGLALIAAIIWGILSIVLSPCHLASIPLIVAFINGNAPKTARRAMALSTVFALGILATIALIALITAAAGRLMGDLGPVVNYLVAGLFFFIGLHLLGIIPMPWSEPCQVGMEKKGLWAALVLGLVFGLALGPCTFAYMAPMLAVSFKVAASRPIFSVLLLSCYGLGHCGVIVAAGTFTRLVQRFLNSNERSRTILRSICGLLVLSGGLYLIYVAP